MNELMKLTSKHKYLIGCSAVLLLAACSSVPPPTEQLAVSRAAIESAQTAGAPEFAAADLAQARSKFERAQAAMRDEDYLRARRLAEEAAVDAQLAQARAGSVRAQTAAAQVDQSIRALRSELERAASPAATPAPAGVPR